MSVESTLPRHFIRHKGGVYIYTDSQYNNLHLFQLLVNLLNLRHPLFHCGTNDLFLTNMDNSAKFLNILEWFPSCGFLALGLCVRPKDIKQHFRKGLSWYWYYHKQYLMRIHEMIEHKRISNRSSPWDFDHSRRFLRWENMRVKSGAWQCEEFLLELINEIEAKKWSVDCGDWGGLKCCWWTNWPFKSSPKPHLHCY